MLLIKNVHISTICLCMPDMPPIWSHFIQNTATIQCRAGIAQSVHWQSRNLGSFPSRGNILSPYPKKHLIWSNCYSCYSLSLTMSIRRQMKLHCPEACPIGWNHFMLTHTVRTVYTCTHICLSALKNWCVTGWAKTYIIILTKRCESTWGCNKMQPVTQDEKILPVSTGVQHELPWLLCRCPTTV
jgi:hypothetical protein